MNFAENKMVQLITGKENLQQTSFEELHELNDKYPYFSAARLLLAKKMKKENHPGFLQQIQKTALYFPNPFWLHYQLIHEEIFTEEPQDAAPAIISAEKELPSEDLLVASEILEEENKEAADVNKDKSEDEFKEEELAANDKITEEIPNTKLAEILQQQAADFKKPVEENAKLQIETEPYYTVDYFASQGIKLDTQNQDKLGTRVLRFTDWLKQMKRINAQPSDLGTSPEMEHQVQNIAASSNEPKEVLTEAMAEVLVKQGKIDKAVQLYIKLSFLEPQKSAYFASRIQALKGI